MIILFSLLAALILFIPNLLAIMKPTLSARVAKTVEVVAYLSGFLFMVLIEVNFILVFCALIVFFTLLVLLSDSSKVNI